MIVLANAKKAAILDGGRAYLNTLTLRLFTNDEAIDGDTVIGDLDECVDGGYAPVTGVAFAASTLNGADRGQTVAPPQTWVFTLSGSPFAVWGYMFTDPADGNALVYSDKRAAAFDVDDAGTPYTVTPKVELDTLA